MAYVGQQPVVGRYILLDQISGGFNGTATGFTMTAGGQGVIPGLAQNVLLSLGGVIQQPGVDYLVSGSGLTFTTAPVSGTTFFATVLGDAQAVGTPSDGTVIPASIASSGTFVFPNVTVSGVTTIASGSAAAPSLSISGDANTGLYSPSADQISITTSGTERFRIDNNGQLEAVSLGTAAAPTFSFTTDPNTGIYSPGADQLAISTNGTGRLFVDASGNVGINRSAPQNYSGYKTLEIGDTSGGVIILRNTAASQIFEIAATSTEAYFSTTNISTPTPITFKTTNTERLRITAAGLVGIGTSSPLALLDVRGNVYMTGNGTSRQTTAVVNTGGAFESGVESSAGAAVFTGSTAYASVIGSQNSTPLQLGTNGAIRATLDSSGRLGIGTNAPQRLLHLSTSDNVPLYVQTTNANCYLQLQNNTGLYYIKTTGNNLVFESNSGEVGRWDSSGRLLVGTSTARASSIWDESALQIEGTTYQRSSLSIINNQNSAAEPGISLGKSRGTTLGSNTVVQINDFLGTISFQGSDGSSLIRGAQISCAVDNTPGTNDMPGRLVFSTTADGASFPTERMRIQSNGYVGINDTSPSTRGMRFSVRLTDTRYSGVSDGGALVFRYDDNGTPASIFQNLGMTGSNQGIGLVFQLGDSAPNAQNGAAVYAQGETVWGSAGSTKNAYLRFDTASSGVMNERMRITSEGDVYIGQTSTSTPGSANTITGLSLRRIGQIYASVNGDQVMVINRNTNDGGLILFNQDGTQEGSISVSGTTVSYNGAHLSRWSQLPSGAERTEILRGTVLSNLDEMCEWGEEDNEQLNRMKVSDVEGDKNVSGVFQAWDDDDDTYTNDFYCAMTGDFVIRIGSGVTVERGDLLISAGDGTAKPQEDDIIRSKTIAKVTSTTVSCTYPDGSYCVPCVLMAC